MTDEAKPDRETKRMRDKCSGELGTAVEAFGRNRYRVEWDLPTPYQWEARPEIPSRFFEWVEP